MIVEADDDLRVRHELERKYLESLAHVAAKMDMGEISQEAGVTAFEAVYNSVSGLVGWEDLNEIMAGLKDIYPRPNIERRCFFKGSEMCLVKVELADLTIVRRSDGIPKRKSVTYLTLGDAHNEAERVCLKLMAAGWSELE